MDIFYDLTEVTKNFQPYYEQRMQGIQTEVELTSFEKDELMFEDQEYLKKYFAEMRDKISADLQNVDDYFPAHTHQNPSQLY